MIVIANYLTTFDEYVENTAVVNLTDAEYELEYQGLYFVDKIRYLINKGINLKPLALENGIKI